MTHSSRLLSIASLVVAGALVSTSAVAVRGAQTQGPEADRAHRRPAEPSAGHARIPGRQPAVPEGAVRRPGRQRAGLFQRLADEDRRWPGRRRQRRARQGGRRPDLRRRREGQSRHPGRPDQGHRRARGARCRPRLRALRGGGSGRGARRGDVPMDWRFLRGSLLGQPDVEAAVRPVPGAPGDARREAVLDPRRVVLQHALDGRCSGEEPDHAAARRHAERRSAQGTLRLARKGPTTTSSPRAAKPKP